HFVIALVLMFVIFVAAGDVRNQRVLTKLDSVEVGAKNAGIRAGDTVVAIDGKRITNWDQVSGVIVHHHAGDRVVIVVDRDGERIAKDVTLTQRVQDGQTSVIAGISPSVITPHPSVLQSLALRPA